MNIIDAIKSGKRIKRKADAIYVVVAKHEDTGALFLSHSHGGYHTPYLSLDALLADDWEIEEEKRTITRAQFIDALECAFYNGQSVSAFPHAELSSLIFQRWEVLK